MLKTDQYIQQLDCTGIPVPFRWGREAYQLQREQAATGKNFRRTYISLTLGRPRPRLPCEGAPWGLLKMALVLPSRRVSPNRLSSVTDFVVEQRRDVPNLPHKAAVSPPVVNDRSNTPLGATASVCSGISGLHKGRGSDLDWWLVSPFGMISSKVMAQKEKMSVLPSFPKEA